MTERELIEQIRRLSSEQQRRVLDFIRSLQAPGIPGPALLQRAAEINFASDDLEEIRQAIEEGCERIDWGEW